MQIDPKRENIAQIKTGSETDSQAQPWQPTSFDVPRPTVSTKSKPPVQAHSLPEATAAKTPPEQSSAVNIQAILQEAQQKGYAEGLEKGIAAGRETGYQLGLRQGAAQMQETQKQLNALMAGLKEALEEVESRWAEEVVDLALEISKQLVRQAVQFRPEVIVQLVREAIHFLPRVEEEAILKIYLHPLDLALLQEQQVDLIAGNRCRLLEDVSIERGGCRVVSEYSDLDATLPERWRRVAQSLGKDDRWLDEPIEP